MSLPNSENTQPLFRLLRRPTVEHLTGLSRSTIYSRMKANTFPSQVNLGGHSVAWNESEIYAWIQDRIDESKSINTQAH